MRIVLFTAGCGLSALSHLPKLLASLGELRVDTAGDAVLLGLMPTRAATLREGGWEGAAVSKCRSLRLKQQSCLRSRCWWG